MGIVYGKPKHCGINKQKATRNLRSIAEERAGRKCGGLRVLNSYWVAHDAVHKWFEVVIGPDAQGDPRRRAHQLDLQPRHEAPRTPWTDRRGPACARAPDEGQARHEAPPVADSELPPPPVPSAPPLALSSLALEHAPLALLGFLRARDLAAIETAIAFIQGVCRCKPR